MARQTPRRNQHGVETQIKFGMFGMRHQPGLGGIDNPLLLARRRVSGSPIGGIRETQELLDFCAEKNILPETETVRIDEVDHAFKRMEKADVRYRFVIDMGSLLA